MSRRTRALGSPVSFFAFQDIITSVTGIIILITLLLVLELMLRTGIPVVVAVADFDPDGIEHQIDARNAELRHVERELERERDALRVAGETSPFGIQDAIARVRAEIQTLQLEQARAQSALDEANRRLNE